MPDQNAAPTPTPASTSPIAQSDNQAFVVYVPPLPSTKPNTDPDNTVQSCLRLGVFHPDEEITYNNVTAASTTFLQLDAYSSTNGIAMLTPGTISLIATEGVSMLSKSNSSSTTGMTYSVTADPFTNQVISAELLDKKFGGWVNESFSRATEVSINTSFQTAFSLSANYEFSAGLAFSNVLGVSYENVVGINVSQTLGMGISIEAGNMTTTIGGETYDYGADLKDSMADRHRLAILEDKHAPGLCTKYENAEKVYVLLAQILAAAAAAASAIYAATIAGLSEHEPSKVKGALNIGEEIGIACVTANGLVTAAGIVLGILQMRAHQASKGITRFEMAKGSVALFGDANTTFFVGKKPEKAPVPPATAGTPIDPGKDSIWIETGVGIKMKAEDKSITNVTKDGIELSFDNGNATVKMDANGLTLKLGTNTIKMTNKGIEIKGPGQSAIDITAGGIDIQGTTLKFAGQQVQVTT